MDLRYQTAIVTGAGAGLGREIAIALSRLGAAVLAADRDGGSAEETAALVREARVAAWSMRVDVCDDAELQLLAGRARDLGGADLLVNNAGGWTEAPEQYPEAPAEAWSRTLDLNLRAPMRLTQLFMDQLHEPSPGRIAPGIVNVSSEAALGAAPYGSPEYAAAKAGLIRFTTSAARADIARRARVMAVVPGWIGLPRAHEEWAGLTAEERRERGPLVPPARVAKAVVDLLARGAAGQVVPVTGEGSMRVTDLGAEP